MSLARFNEGALATTASKAEPARLGKRRSQREAGVTGIDNLAAIW